MENIYSNYGASMRVSVPSEFSTGSSSAVSKKFVTESPNPAHFTTIDENPRTEFASAVYGDGPYSLLCPNAKSDILAQNVDYLA